VTRDAKSKSVDVAVLDFLSTTAVMSNLAPIQSTPIAETQVHASDGQDTPLVVPTEPLKTKKKCLVLSLIRHGQVRPLRFSKSLNHILKLRW
jgi:hypothetical protein